MVHEHKEAAAAHARRFCHSQSPMSESEILLSSLLHPPQKVAKSSEHDGWALFAELRDTTCKIYSIIKRFSFVVLRGVFLQGYERAPTAHLVTITASGC